MKRWISIVSAIAACAFLSGCATLRTEARQEAAEPPGIAVRLPAATAATLNLESRQPSRYPELPQSVADETRGRWLTLFELDYTTPALPDPIHPGSEEIP